MSEKRVLVVESEQVLGAGLQSLLSKREDLIVIGASFADMDALITVICQAQPSVVIMDEGFLSANLFQIMTVFSQHPKIRIIAMSLEDNHVQVYDKQQLWVKRSADFLAVV